MIQFMIVLVIMFLTYTTFNAPLPERGVRNRACR